MSNQPPYPEYPDHLAYVRDEQTREAFKYLAYHSQRIPGFQARPRPHGNVWRNLHFYNENNRSLYSFIVNQEWIRFYFRFPEDTHPNIDLSILKDNFIDVNTRANGEFTFKIRNVEEAKKALRLAFPGLPQEQTPPEEIPEGRNYPEGAITRVSVNRYERDSRARNACIKHYGYDCYVCGFNFQEVYGSLGENFIHVHHLHELSSLGENYAVDPIHDMRPVCPNCHAMLHKRSPPLTIDELKEIMDQTKHGCDT